MRLLYAGVAEGRAGGGEAVELAQGQGVRGGGEGVQRCDTLQRRGGGEGGGVGGRGFGRFGRPAGGGGVRGRGQTVTARHAKPSNAARGGGVGGPGPLVVSFGAHLRGGGGGGGLGAALEVDELGEGAADVEAEDCAYVDVRFGLRAFLVFVVGRRRALVRRFCCFCCWSVVAFLVSRTLSPVCSSFAAASAVGLHNVFSTN